MATSQPQSDTGRFLATTTPLNRDGQLIGKIKADFAGLVPEMDHLVTISLEAKLPRRIIPLLSEKLALRPFLEPVLFKAVFRRPTKNFRILSRTLRKMA